MSILRDYIDKDLDKPKKQWCLFEELTGKLVYLASAYSHPDKKIEAARADEVATAGAILFNKGIMAISPIALESRYRGQTQLETNWVKCIVLDRKLLIQCDAIVILVMNGIYDSKGVLAETLIAIERSIPIYYYYQDTQSLVAVPNEQALDDFMEGAQ